MKKYKPDNGIWVIIAVISVFFSITIMALPSCIMSIFIDSEIYSIFKTIVFAFPLVSLITIVFGFMINIISKKFLKPNSFIDGNEAGFWKHKFNISDITEIHFFIGDIRFRATSNSKNNPLPYRATIVCKNKKYELLEPSFLFLLALKKKCPSLKFSLVEKSPILTFTKVRKSDVLYFFAMLLFIGIIFAVIGVFFA